MEFHQIGGTAQRSCFIYNSRTGKQSNNQKNRQNVSEWLWMSMFSTAHWNISVSFRCWKQKN